MAKKKAKSEAASKQDKDEITFEESLGQLEAVVTRLEMGDLSLDEAIAQYEMGVKRLRECHRALETAERKIELLSGIRADGTPVTEPFDDPDESLDEKQANRTIRRSATPPESKADQSPRLF